MSTVKVKAIHYGGEITKTLEVVKMDVSEVDTYADKLAKTLKGGILEIMVDGTQHSIYSNTGIIKDD